MILVVGALPYAALGLPVGTSFLAFGGLCYLGLGVLERYVRRKADRGQRLAIRAAGSEEEEDLRRE